MSVYLSLDGSEPQDFASNKGWGDFCRWADGLDADAYPQVIHLRLYGWCQQIDRLTAQLDAARRDDAPADEETKQVLDSLLLAASGNGNGAVLTVTS